MNRQPVSDHASTPDIWTVGRLIRFLEDYFRQRRFQAPRLDAELLLAHALDCTRVHLYIDWQKPVDKPERDALKALVKRRTAGEPAAYILERREFWSMPFLVDRRVLIPRPDTEILVETAIQWVGALPDDGRRIADIGTGSGNIACALAKSLPHAKIAAVDVSEEALAVAQANAAQLDLSKKIEFFQGDLVNPLENGEKFDMVVSNPPYVTAQEWRALPEEIKQYEPTGALVDQGSEGLALTARLLEESLRVLKPTGVVLVEIGAGRAEAATVLARDAGYLHVQVKEDYAGVPRVLLAGLQADEER